MMEFLSKIEHLPFSEWVLQSPSIWAYATILTSHTIGMMIVAGIAGIIDLRLLGIGSTTPVRPLEKLFPLAWFGFWINAVTGTILLMADATTKLTNLDFYVKMVFVFLGVVLLIVMRRKVFRNPELDLKPLPANVKGLAWLSLICWVGAITAGRLLAYLGPVSGVPGLKNR
ncbi:MAG: hypothetical protein JO307_32745 [Bryobacterales bacterium]|nr:hypothetical protein [Bryobacterales bacterium]MBV9399012.1 hypothetical protein [Bryobacterales bacterium]